MPILIFILTVCLMGCSAGNTAAEKVGSFSGTDSEKDYIRASDVLVEDVSSAAENAEPRKNPDNALNIPTQITKVGDTYFIVDCYHDQIIYNDDLTAPLSEWSVMTDELNKGHTLASDGTVYVTDDTENDRIMVFERSGDSFVFTQKFDDITSRPHYIVYDGARDLFFAWCSTSGEMYVFRRDKEDNRMYLTDVRSIPELDGVYVRSFTIIGDEVYFVSGNSSIIKADLDTFKILEEYPVPSTMAGMIQLTKIEDFFYITISTDDKWDQNYATIIRCRSLKDLQNNDFEDIYHYFVGGGTPYYITEIDGYYYLTEHRVPGHSIWRFRPEGEDIKVESIFDPEEPEINSDGFYQKLAKGEDVNILINGDSIAAGAGASDGKSWDARLKSFIESEYHVNCNITNISMGGNGSYAGYVRESILDDGRDYDLVIFCYGQNDGRKKIAADYESLIRAAREKYPKAEMISILESSQREYTKKIKTIEELDRYYDIPEADMIAAFNDSGVPYDELTVDDKHPNDRGHGLYLDVVSNVIKENVSNNASYSKTMKSPLNENALGAKDISYYPAEAFTRKDDLTWTITMDKEVRGIPGIYQTFGPGDGKVVINSDSGAPVESDIAWPYDFKQDYITALSDEETGISGTVEIIFSSPEWADGFKGLIG
ncbi:MAG: hypothetical protein K5668_01280 [Lachnospiraceae bacterium]|nr:hypothetical protein [Lachnospiraceae bacterium]